MDILSFFMEGINKKASDIHLVGGSVPTLRVNGDLIKINSEKLDSEQLTTSIRSILDEADWLRFTQNKELDFAKEFEGHRFRINLHQQEGKIGLSARAIPTQVPRPEQIGLDETIYKLTHLKDGLVLVTGPSGSGKSTTLAAMVNIINQERRCHIVTIEDPIEFLFNEAQSVIEQREIGIDTHDFPSALKFVLRQDPNVIMVGEMRDQETISMVLTAAETGHLVFSTLHTSTASETIKRIVDVFPGPQQQQIAVQLASNLRAVICQQIMPRKDGGLTVVREIMVNNSAISNLIRNNQVDQINSVIQTSSKEGMITMNKSIELLYRDGVISEEVAKNRMRDMNTHAAYY